MVILGFDPGGERRFGWCVAHVTQGRLRLRCADIASNAKEAVDAVIEKASSEEVVAAGIDSPLMWVSKGDRKADVTVRIAIEKLGAPYPNGTVQHVNSLRGACLSQGIMAAHLLRRVLPDIRITESHPKALLWLLNIATKGHPEGDVGVSGLSDLIESNAMDLSDHERDAVLGAVAAFAMIENRSGWRNLYRDEEAKYGFTPVPNVEYWMPIK
jgi:hypothetical protein